VLGESGAFKALTLDLAEELGLPLAPLHDEDSPALRAALPVSCRCRTRWTSPRRACRSPIIYTNTLGALLDDARVGAVVAGIIQSDPVTAKIKVPAIIAALEGRAIAKPLVFAGLDEGADMPAHYIAAPARSRHSVVSHHRAGLSRAGRFEPPCRAGSDQCGPAALALPALAGEAGVVPNIRPRAAGAAGHQLPAGRFAADAEARSRRRGGRLSRGDEGAGGGPFPQERCGRGDAEPC
jgi:hypothetical protein